MKTAEDDKEFAVRLHKHEKYNQGFIALGCPLIEEHRVLVAGLVRDAYELTSRARYQHKGHELRVQLMKEDAKYRLSKRSRDFVKKLIALGSARHEFIFYSDVDGVEDKLEKAETELSMSLVNLLLKNPKEATDKEIEATLEHVFNKYITHDDYGMKLKAYPTLKKLLVQKRKADISPGTKHRLAIKEAKAEKDMKAKQQDQLENSTEAARVLVEVLRRIDRETESVQEALSAAVRKRKKAELEIKLDDLRIQRRREIREAKNSPGQFLRKHSE